MELKGKVAVVTGGASGIGLSTAKAFLAGGARVAILDWSEEALKQAVAELGDGVSAVACDVANEDSVVKAFDQVERDLGGVDIAVLNAGILRDGLLLKVDKETKKVSKRMSLQQWQSVIDVNLTGVFLTGREAATRIIDGGRKGVMVLISSISRAGNVGQSNYSASKAGVAVLTRIWGKELARFGVRVACVSPGFIGTPMVMKDMKPEMMEHFKKLIPIGRLGEPEEIASAILYVVDNDLMCGTVMEPSGGMSL
jgi:3-oxoacyl-[acyl-carrier protein] reductase